MNKIETINNVLNNLKLRCVIDELDDEHDEAVALRVKNVCEDNGIYISKLEAISTWEMMSRYQSNDEYDIEIGYLDDEIIFNIVSPFIVPAVISCININKTSECKNMNDGIANLIKVSMDRIEFAIEHNKALIDMQMKRFM